MLSNQTKSSRKKLQITPNSLRPLTKKQPLKRRPLPYRRKLLKSMRSKQRKRLLLKLKPTRSSPKPALERKMVPLPLNRTTTELT